MGDVIYCGCRAGNVGHHEFLPGMTYAPRSARTYALDIAYHWAKESGWNLHHVTGPGEALDAGRRSIAYNFGYEPMTVISRLDNTVDKRPGSHSTFLLPGRLNLHEAISVAAGHFPEIFDRLESEETDT